jgi:hypothetical protein
MKHEETLQVIRDRIREVYPDDSLFTRSALVNIFRHFIHTKFNETTFGYLLRSDNLPKPTIVFKRKYYHIDDVAQWLFTKGYF